MATDYEQKYKGALERAKKFKDKYGGDYAGYIFPELAESEDERIRKELKEAFEAYDIESKWNGIPIRSIFAWLEEQKDKNCLACDQHLKGYIAGRKVTEEEKQKEQKEQKPVDLSEMMVHKEPYIAPVPTPMVADEQKPAEWSEEDEENLEKVIWYIEKGCKLIFQKPDKLISWLKCLLLIKI